jgi:hypothetical protein
MCQIHQNQAGLRMAHHIIENCIYPAFSIYLDWRLQYLEISGRS